MVDIVITLPRLTLKIIFKSKSQNLRMTIYAKMENQTKNPQQPYNSSAVLHSYDNNACCDFFYNGGEKAVCWNVICHIIYAKKPSIGKALYSSFNKTSSSVTKWFSIFWNESELQK